MLLKDKIVLVTGSSMGIGLATAKLCLKEGANVMLHGRTQSYLDDAVASLDVSKDRIGTYVADFTVSDEAIKLIPATVERFGRIDCLVNNAGIYPRNNIDELDDELFRKVIKVNLKTPIFLTKEAMPYFRKNGSGTVLNIGSINSYCGTSDLLIYSASKGGLMTATRNLGAALGKENVRVNQINVGWTLTENEIKTWREQGYPDGWEKDLPPVLTPTGRLLRPEDVARHVVFWISDQSVPANGTVYDLEQYPMIGRNLIPELVASLGKDAYKDE